jgi:subtilisin-like proprotein convertase family protein
MNLPTNCYCSAGATQTTLEKISRVRYNQIDNSSTSTAGYENFLNISTPAYLGATSQITINLAGGFAADQSLVWIDFNQNGNFSDPGELVFTSANSAGPHIGTITIPATALQGNTRMRVRMHDTSLGPNNTPCGNSTWGQVEDYTVNIQVCVPVTFTTQPSSSSVTCGGNTSFSVTANGSAPVYGWQFRVNASSPWQDLTNTGIYTGATTNTLTLTNVLASFSGYQYRALLSGACAALDYSQPATLTVNPPVTNVTPASASICNGTIQALSITNSVSAPTTGVWAASAGLPLAIPDNTPVGTTSTVSVSGIPAGSLVTNIAVRFSMTHTWAGDLVMNLRAPNGQVLNLVGLLNNGQGLNNTANFTNTIIDSTATTPLSGAPAPRTGRFRADRYAVSTAFNPIASTTGFWSSLLSTLNGNWTLGLSDLGPGDLGTLTAWEIQITYVAANFAQGVWTASPAAPNTMFTDAAATIPYAGAPATTIYVRPAVNTNYSVSFSTPTPCQSAVATVPVSVTNPVVGLALSPATRAVCLGGSTTFTAAVTSGGPITYQWERSIDGGLTWSAVSGATSTTLTISGVTQNMTGYRYRVVATAAPCGSVTSNVGTLTVNPLPVVTISSPVVRLVPGRTTTVTATSTPNAAAGGWSWTLNGGAIAGTTNTQVVNIDQLGSYQATVVDVNGCTNKSNSLVIGAEATDKLWIYPNPTVNGAFQVRLYFAGDLAEQRVITIYNPLGQVIESRAITLVRGSAPYQRMDFNLGGGATAKGSYVVKVAHQFTGKVISGIILVQ